MTEDNTNPIADSSNEHTTLHSIESTKPIVPKSSMKFNRKAVQWRRNTVWMLKAKGYSISQIAEELTKNQSNTSISEDTVRRDLRLKIQEIEYAFQEYVEKDLVKEHHLAKTGLESVLHSAWKIYQQEEDNETRLSALRVINETYALLQRLSGDPEIIKEAISFVEKVKKRKSTHNVDSKEEVVSSA
jgi:hypothetical protein